MYRLFRAPRGLRGKLFKLTGPIFLETLLMLTLGVVDTLMLSHHSDNAVAAVGVVNQLLNMVFLLFNITTTGTSVMCALYFGAKDNKSFIQVLGTSLLFNAGVGCLINKYSASDGDLFPWGFRALGLGKLIGTRTWGGIIGISGPLPYMDGTDIRVPFFTSYDPKTGNWIIENHGVDPDILIDNDPIKEWNGEDQQLDRAIEEVMKQLKERKPLAPVPAPRDWSHK